MKRLLLLISIIFSAAWCGAAGLSGSDAKLIENSGIPIYKKSVFAYGNQSVGFRFASSEKPETVREWYRDKLSSWVVYDQYGGWILYNGEPGLGMAAVMGKDQVSVQTNGNLPEWHSLDKSMTTEIVIMIPQ